MSDLNTRLAGQVLLLITTVLSLAGPTFGEDLKPPKVAPWNIQSVRQKYYSGLDAARQEAVRQVESEGLTLSYNADGTVIRDEAFEKADRYYSEKRDALQSEIRGNSRREDEFNALSQAAGAKVKREGGAKPGDAAYSGALSDRDVELTTKAQVESLTDAARNQGYHVVSGPGYVKILELDTVVWEPFRSHGPGGVELRHDDPEVMLSYEVIVGQQKASVTQQVKKVEELYREEIPDSTQKQHELVASVAKAAGKSADAIGQSVSEPSGVLDRERLNQYKLLKSRTLTKDDLISPFDKPEAQARQLNDLRHKAREDIKACDVEQTRQREEKIKELKEERTTLATKMEQETDDVKRHDLEVRISEIDDSTRALEKDLAVDGQTRRAITRKNPKLATAMGWDPKPTTVIPDRAGELARISRVIDEALEISKQEEPRDTSATEAFDALADANRTIGKVLNSPFFKIFARVAGMSPGAIKFAEQVGKTSKAVDKNVISPTQKAIESEGFVYETGDGMKEYIARRLKEEAAQGWDITDPRRQELIRREAILRATARGTYQGAKFLPGLGNILQGYEDAFNLTESSVGLVYDTWKSQQTSDMNRFQQEGQLEQAILQAKESRDRLRKQMDTAAKAVEYSKEIAKLLPSLNADIEQLQQQIKDRRVQLESLAPVDGQIPPQGTALDPQLLSGLRGRMETLTRLSKLFTTDCEKAIARVKSGQFPRDELLGERSRLQRRLMDEIDAEYIRIETLLDQVNARIRLVTEPEEVQNVYDALLLDYGQALALASTAEEIASRLERYELLYKDTFRCFTEERKRILEACDFFAQRSVGDENLQKVLSRLRGEMTEFRIPDYQLQENWAHASSLKRDAAWLRKIAAEPPKPPLSAVATPTQKAECEQLQQLSTTWKEPEAAMTAAVDEARAKFRDLRDLLPLEPPAFNIAATELKPQVWGFTVESVRVPADATLILSWDFGDGASAGGPETRRQHAYAKPGEYTVSVRVFLERTDVSEDLGDVSTQITIAGPTPNPTQPDSATTGTIAVPGEERPWLGTSATWFIDKLPGYESFDHASDIYFSFDPWGNGLKALDVRAWHKINIVAGDPEQELAWTLDMTASGGTGHYDPQSGKFSVSLTDCKIEDRLVRQGTGEPYPRCRPDVIRLTGIDPDKIKLTGQLSGQLNWRQYQGSGQLDFGPLFRGRWELGNWDSIDKKMMPVNGYGVAVPNDMRTRKHPVSQVFFFRTEELAKTHFPGIPLDPRGRQDVDGFGDEARWSPYGGFSVRIGRWRATAPRAGQVRIQSAEEYRAFVTRFESLVRNSHLEELLPEK
jgi:hypothetical protein